MEQRLAQADQDQHQHRNDEIFEFHQRVSDLNGARQYIVSIKIGSRIFEPRLFTTLLAIALIALLVSLGRWQLHRADGETRAVRLFRRGRGCHAADRCRHAAGRTLPARRSRAATTMRRGRS